MERETRTITTPIGQNQVVVKSWLTAREKRQISEIFASKAKYNHESKTFDLLDPSILNQTQDKELEIVVISVDGQTDKILETLLEMRTEDFNHIMREVENVVNPEVEEEKKD
jgi:hypothetical protein